MPTGSAASHSASPCFERKGAAEPPIMRCIMATFDKGDGPVWPSLSWQGRYYARYDSRHGGQLPLVSWPTEAGPRTTLRMVAPAWQSEHLADENKYSVSTPK